MKTKIKIIHLEDNKFDAELIDDILNEAEIECDIKVVESRESLLASLERKDIDLILSDYTMRSFNGMEALKITRKLRPDIPFIFVSGTIGEDLAVESLLLGARDYVLKSKLSRLIPAINRVMNEIRQGKEKTAILNRLDMIIKATNDLIWEWDIDNHQFFWNETNQELDDISFRNSINDQEWWNSRIHPHDRLMVTDSLRKAILSTELFWTCEYRILKNESEYAIVKDKANILRDNNGRAVSLVGAMTDITREKEAEETVRWQQLFYEKLLDDANIWIALINLNGVVILWNKRAEILSGYSSDMIIGKSNVWELLFGDSGDRIREISNKAILYKRNVKNLELKCRTKSGNELIISWSSNYVLGRDNKIWGQTFIGEDVTRRKNAELNLIHAKEKAEEMNRLKTNFLANMSHELRTPMVGINGFSQLLIRELDDPDLKEMAEAIHTSGRRLTKTLNLILDLSKIEAEQQKIKLKEVNMSELVFMASNIFWGAAEFKQLTFNIIEKDKNVIAILDENLFNNVIENLLSNAFKFTESGEINIEIGYEIMGGATYSYVKIQDTGIGIPQEMLETIFLEFRQVSEGTGRNFEGSGLGLTITKKFVEKMDGTILVKSELDKGSVFLLRFNTPTDLAITINNEEDILSIESQAINTDKKNEKSPYRLLVVEDDQTSFTLARMILEKYFTIERASNGEEALEKVRKVLYNGILMDINLGRGLTGLETVKRIRLMPEYIKTPITALTAYAFKHDQEEFISKGCDFYLSKPYTSDQLLDIIKKMGLS